MRVNMRRLERRGSSLPVIPGRDTGILRGTVLVQIPESRPGMTGKAKVFLSGRPVLMPVRLAPAMTRWNDVPAHRWFPTASNGQMTARHLMPIQAIEARPRRQYTDAVGRKPMRGISTPAISNPIGRP